MTTPHVVHQIGGDVDTEGEDKNQTATAKLDVEVITYHYSVAKKLVHLNPSASASWKILAASTQLINI